MLSVDKHRLSIGLTPAHDPGASFGRRIKNTQTANISVGDFICYGGHMIYMLQRLACSPFPPSHRIFFLLIADSTDEILYVSTG